MELGCCYSCLISAFFINMDNGLLITLICILGGGFVIILNEINKKKRLVG